MVPYMDRKRMCLLGMCMMAIITVSGPAMAATAPDMLQDLVNGKQQAVPAQQGLAGEDAIGGIQGDIPALLALLNLNLKTFEGALKDGKSLAEIAKAQGISEQAIKDELIRYVNTRIDADIKAGLLQADSAGDMRANIEGYILNMINQKGL